MSNVAAAWKGILEPEEQILWQGRPGTRISFGRRAPARMLFSFFWLGFSVFWMTMAAQASVLFSLFGVPFVAVGIYLIGGDAVLNAYLRRQTWYTLTDQRAFIATDVFGRRGLKSYEIRGDTPLELEYTTPPTVWFAKEHGGEETVRIGFQFIEDAEEVYRLMRNVKRNRA